MEPSGGIALSCSHCGYTSPHSPQFVEFPDGSAKKTYCAHCAGRKERRSFYGGMALSAFFILFASVRLQYESSSLVSAFMLIFFTFSLVMNFIPFPHELIHALTARLVGLRTVAIEIGNGRVLLDRTMFGMRVKIQSPFNSGGTYAMFRKVKGVDWRFAATTAAPGIIELIVGVLALAWFWYGEWPPESTVPRLMMLGTAAALITDAGFNLWPRMAKTPRGIVPNDGMLTLRTLRREPFDLAGHRAGIRIKRAEHAYADRRYDAVASEAAKALALSAAPAVVTNAVALAAEALSESGRAREAVDLLRPTLDRDDLTVEMRAYLAQSFAWAALLTDDPELREEGLRRLDQALQFLPWEGVIAMKLLSLVAASAVDEERRGRVRRLNEGVSKFRLWGEGAAYAELARGLAATVNNDSRLAREHLDKARRLGATMAPLQLLERRIASI